MNFVFSKEASLVAKTAVILAGGQGRRMGGLNKAWLTLGDEKFIERQIKVATQWADEVIVVTNDSGMISLLQQYSSIRMIPDIFAGEGPLAGVHAGLTAASHPIVWILGCDQPFLSGNAASLLKDRMDNGAYQASLPIIGGRPQPLHAIYRKELSGITESLLQAGERRLLALLNNVEWSGIEEKEFTKQGISLHFARDVDTPEQYAQANLLFSEHE
jgi:molybdopterin-guanine dinucleotide biosynthesis protein A